MRSRFLQRRAQRALHQARELGELRKYRALLKAADLLVIDDLFLHKLPPSAGDELADVLMTRYEKQSTMMLCEWSSWRSPGPGGHPKLPHLWPGQSPPPGSGGTRDDYAL